MTTHLTLDPKLLDRGFELSGEPTMTAAVTLALKEFVVLRAQRQLAELFGKLEWDVRFDPRAERSRA